MGLKSFIIFMTLGTVLAWIGWAVIIFSVNPETAGILELFFFYGVLFLALVGTLSLIGVAVRWLIQGRRRGSLYRVSMAFRQACLWALALVLALGLQSVRLLSWWLLVLLIVAFAMIEFTILVLNRPQWEE